MDAPALRFDSEEDEKRTLGWYCSVKGESDWFSEKGPFQRSSFAIAEAARMTPLASTVNALQFGDVFVWAICMGAGAIVLGDWLSAFAFAVACTAARTIIDNRFAPPARRMPRAIGECAGFLVACKFGQHAREHVGLGSGTR